MKNNGTAEVQDSQKIDDLSITELQSYAYRQICTIETAKANLALLEREIERKKKEQAEAANA